MLDITHLCPHNELVHLPYIAVAIKSGGARGVMVIVIGNGYSNTSSNPGRDWLHFT